MSSQSSPEPEFTYVQLTGPSDGVARLMAALSGAGEIVFGPTQSAPDSRGNVSCVARVVTHPEAPVPAAPQTVAFTVQTVFETGTGVVPGLPDSAAARQVEESVTAAVAALPGVGRTRSRVVAVVALPTAQE